MDLMLLLAESPNLSIGIGLGGIGAGLAVIGAASGIGKAAASAVESIARQPEKTGDIRNTMLIAAALIEGVALFAVVVALLTLLQLNGKIPGVAG